jgi:peptidoglycan/xylan/chitin deacetylase (PgdA/CDA1 family)
MARVNGRVLSLVCLPVVLLGSAGVGIERFARQHRPHVGQVIAAAAQLQPAVDVVNPLLVHSQKVLAQQAQVGFAAFSGGVSSEKEVALTFDDGPDPEVTPQILDILKQEGVPATFFVVGSKAEQYPELIRREAEEGHDLGNHTFHHFELTDLDPAGVRAEITRTNDALEQIVGTKTRWFRAPGCHYTPDALKVIRKCGMVRVDTQDNSGDWANPGVSAILHRTLTHLSPGDVILCHDRIPQTVEALPRLIHTLRKRGYRIVPLAQLALQAQSTPGFRPVIWPRGEGVQIQAIRPRLKSHPLLPKRVLPSRPPTSRSA